MTDLLKILKAGDKVFSLIHGKTLKIKAIDPNDDLPIDLGSFKFNRHGSVIPGGTDCLLFPSETEKTWDNYSPFLKGDNVLVSNSSEKGKRVGVFAYKADGLYHIYGEITGHEISYFAFEYCEYFTAV